MLIITRRVSEKIMIGDDIQIILLGVQFTRAKFGIVAPKNIPIHREEIYIQNPLIQDHSDYPIYFNNFREKGNAK